MMMMIIIIKGESLPYALPLRHSVNRGKDILFFNFGIRYGGSEPPACRFIPGKGNQYPFYGRFGGPRSRSERVWKISPTPGFVSRTVHPVASHYTYWATSAATVMVPVLTYCLEYCGTTLWRVTAYSKWRCLTPFANTRPAQSNSTLAAEMLAYRERGDTKWRKLANVRNQWHLSPFVHYKHRITNLEMCQRPKSEMLT